MSKFTSGAWIPVIVIPLVVMLFRGIHRHYQRLSRELNAPLDLRPKRLNHTVVVLVGSIHKGVLQALAYARSLNPNHLLAVHVVSSEEEQEQMEKEWAEYQIDVPLEMLYSPYRELSAPIQRFLDDLDARWDNDIITVVVPEFVVRRWWEHVLHNQSALFLKGKLLFRRNTVVTSIPYHLGDARGRGGGPEPLTSPVGGATVREVQPWR